MACRGFLLVCIQCLLLNAVFNYPLQGNLQNLGNGLPLGFPNALGNIGGPGLIGSSNIGTSGFGNLKNEALIGNAFGNLGLNNDLLGSQLGLANTQSAVLTGTVAQAVAPSFSTNLQPQLAPVVTEIVPSLEFGDITLDGALPVGGTIKVSGTFPVYGVIGVDGSLPSYGTAFIDTGNGLIAQSLEGCSCGFA